MSRARPAALAAVLSLSLGCGGGAPSTTAAASPVAPPTLVLVDGKVFTADPARPWAEAVAIRGEHIAAVGTSAELRALAGASTRIVELGGRVVIPGINDAHVHAPSVWRPHPVELATAEPTIDELVAAASLAARERPAGTWLGFDIGDDLYDDPRANRAALDAVTPHHPVWTSDRAGHARLVNTAALAALGIAETAADPPNGRYGRDASGRLTGWLFESASWRASRALAETQDDGAIARAAAEFEDAALRAGITSVQTMSLVRADRLAAVLDRGPRRLRWRVIRWPYDRGAEAIADEVRGPRVRIDGVKYVLDGTPLERNAAVTSPYRDRPGWRGEISFSSEELSRILSDAAAGGPQLLVHAVGDETIEQVLDRMEALARADRWRARRVRIEHGDVIQPAQVARASALGVVVVQNPVHFLMPQRIEARLGDCRGTCQPLRSLSRAGIVVALGSDGPLNPFLGIMAASAHPTSPGEALSREDAIVAYTRGAAFAERTEASKGMLAPGMLADLAVLTHDVFAVPAAQVPSTAAWMTIVGGEIVHAAEPTP